MHRLKKPPGESAIPPTCATRFHVRCLFCHVGWTCRKRHKLAITICRWLRHPRSVPHSGWWSRPGTKTRGSSSCPVGKVGIHCRHFMGRDTAIGWPASPGVCWRVQQHTRYSLFLLIENQTTALARFARRKFSGTPAKWHSTLRVCNNVTRLHLKQHASIVFCQAGHDDPFDSV